MDGECESANSRRQWRTEARRAAICWVTERLTQLSTGTPLDSGSAPSCSYCPAPHLAAWPRTLSKHSHSIYIQVVQFFGCMCSFFPEQGLYFLPQTVIMLEQILIFGLELVRGGWGRY